MSDSEQHNDLSIQAGQLGTQMDIWGTLRQDSNVAKPFARNTPEDEHRRIIARHKLWLDSIQHECPSPFVHFRIGVYMFWWSQPATGSLRVRRGQVTTGSAKERYT